MDLRLAPLVHDADRKCDKQSDKQCPQQLFFKIANEHHLHSKDSISTLKLKLKSSIFESSFFHLLA